MSIPKLSGGKYEGDDDFRFVVWSWSLRSMRKAAIGKVEELYTNCGRLPTVGGAEKRK